MQSLVYRNPWDIELEDKPTPDSPTGTEVLINIKATGICGTDIGIVTGLYQAQKNVTLGHESAGQVVAVGDRVTTVKPGDAVLIDPTYYCGYCNMCRTNRPNHCEHKTTMETGVSLDGTFATHYKTPERFVYPMSADISYAAGTLTEPLSCALTGVGQIRTRPEMRTVILGAGPMGVLYSHALATVGLGGQVVEISDRRRELAEQAMAPGWLCSPSLEQAVNSISGTTGLLDLVVDTTGVLAGQSINVLARGGQLLSIGLREYSCPIDMRKIADESLSIVGSIDSIGTFSSAAHLINTGVIPAEKIITHQVNLNEFKSAFELVGCSINNREHTNTACSIKTVMYQD